MRKRVTSTKSPLHAVLENLPGGWHTAFRVLKSTADKDGASEAAKLLAAYEELCSVDPQVNAEKIAGAAGVTDSHMLGVIVEAAHEMGVRLSKLISALHLDEVMERAVKEAKKSTGFKDRERLLQAAGLYPTPAGVTINNSPTAIAAARAAMSTAIESTDGLDEFERDTMDSTSFLRGVDNAAEQKRIESPANFVNVTATAAKEPVEAEPAP